MERTAAGVCRYGDGYQRAACRRKEMPPDPEAILGRIREEAGRAVSVLRLTASRISLRRRQKEIVYYKQPENTFYMLVVITDGSGKKLYRSRELRPSGQEMTGELKKSLKQESILQPPRHTPSIPGQERRSEAWRRACLSQ